LGGDRIWPRTPCVFNYFSVLGTGSTFQVSGCTATWSRWMFVMGGGIPGGLLSPTGPGFPRSSFTPSLNRGHDGWKGVCCAPWCLNPSAPRRSGMFPCYTSSHVKKYLLAVFCSFFPSSPVLIHQILEVANLRYLCRFCFFFLPEGSCLWKIYPSYIFSLLSLRGFSFQPGYAYFGILIATCLESFFFFSPFYQTLYGLVTIKICRG